MGGGGQQLKMLVNELLIACTVHQNFKIVDFIALIQTGLSQDDLCLRRRVSLMKANAPAVENVPKSARWT